MSAWTSIRLLGSSTWDPASLCPTVEPTFVLAPSSWRSGSNLPLDALTVRIRPKAATPAGATVVHPSDIDQSGRISTVTQSTGASTYRVEDGGLLPGDLLIPPGPTPPVLVGEPHRGLRFSPAFLAVRVVEDVIDPLVLWCLLGCRSGTRARAQLAQESGSLRGAHLRQILVPTPLLAAQLRWLEKARSVWEHTADDLAHLNLTSRWQLVSLPNHHDWNAAITSGQQVAAGPRLGSVATIRQGERIDKAKVVEVPIPDAVPILTGQDVARGAAPSRWLVGADRSRTASSPTIVLPRIVRHPIATLLPDTVIAADSLLLVTPHDAQNAENLVELLNSPEVRRQLQAAASGVAIPMVNRRVLESIRLPEAGSAAAPMPRLELQLEELVWT